MNNITKWVLAGLGFMLAAVFVVMLTNETAQPERTRERTPIDEPAPGRDQESSKEQSTSTQDKQAYVDDVAPLIMDTADVMEQVSKSLNEFADGKVEGKEASTDLHGFSDDLGSLKSDIEDLRPPQELEKFQKYLVDGIDFFEKGAEKAATGIEESDPDMLEEAATLFEKGTEEINKANDEFDENTKDLKTNKSYDFNI